jgi:hypothetical protein
LVSGLLLGQQPARNDGKCGKRDSQQGTIQGNLPSHNFGCVSILPAMGDPSIRALPSTDSADGLSLSTNRRCPAQSVLRITADRWLHCLG